MMGNNTMIVVLVFTFISLPVGYPLPATFRNRQIIDATITYLSNTESLLYRLSTSTSPLYELRFEQFVDFKDLFELLINV